MTIREKETLLHNLPIPKPSILRFLFLVFSAMIISLQEYPTTVATNECKHCVYWTGCYSGAKYCHISDHQRMRTAKGKMIFCMQLLYTVGKWQIVT